MLAVVHDLAEAQGWSSVSWCIQAYGTDEQFKSETLPREKISPRKRNEDWKQ